MLNLVTGKIGSGKSTVMNILEELGFRCIRTDDYARALLEEPEVFQFTVKLFGKRCLGDDNKIDREFLRYAFVSRLPGFSDYEEHIASRIYDYLLTLRDEAPVFVECAWIGKFVMPLMKFHFDNVIFVGAEDEIRHDRLLIRGVSREQISRTDDLQHTGILELDGVYHLDNSGSLSELTPKVMELLGELKFSASEKDAIFRSKLRAAPEFVKDNVYCYLYYNNFGCAKCPTPCKNSDANYARVVGAAQGDKK